MDVLMLFVSCNYNSLMFRICQFSSVFFLPKNMYLNLHMFKTDVLTN